MSPDKDPYNFSLGKEDSRMIKEFLYKMLRWWYWFAIAIMIGGGLGFLQTKRTPPTYRSSSLLLIKETESKTNLAQNLGSFMFAGKTELENHIGILTSYTLNRKTIDELGWFSNWYVDEPLLDYELYGNEPFSITIDASQYNLYNVPVYVSLIGENKYKINVEQKVWYKGREVDLIFSEEGLLGEPFVSKYFNFTLYAKDYRKGKNYYFVLKNLDWLAMGYMSRLEVTPYDEMSDMISLSISDNVPQKTVDFLNELTNQFIKYGLNEKNRKSKQTIDFIDDQLSEVIDTLDIAGKDLTRYRARNKIVDLTQESELIVGKLVGLDNERSKEQSKYEYFLNLRNDLNDTDKIKEITAPSVVGITDPTLNNLLVQLTDLFNQRERISYSASEKNPVYIQIQNGIELAQRNLKKTLDNLINSSQFLINDYDQQIAKINREMSSIPQTEQELMNIRRKFELSNELYTFLVQRRAEAAINHASNQPDANVLDPARITTVAKVGPNRMLYLIGGVILGGIIPFIILMFSSYFNEKLVSAEEIEQMTDIPIMGNIIHNPYSNDPTPAIKNPRSAIAESLRELRTNLRFLQPDAKCKITSVHSVIPGEGKTFTTLNLATILAMNGKKVLLIDADLRKPSIHNFLQLENKEGLSTYLVGSSNLQEIRQKTSIPNLTLISGGPIPPSPSELIESDLFEDLLNSFKDHYEYIIIDNPPLTLVSDGINNSYHSNMNLFVLKQDYSSKDQVKFINYISKQRKMKNPGIIFNDINTKKYVYAGYYGSKYNYKNSYGHYYHK